MVITECICVADHNPNPVLDQDHHVVPLSWVKAGAEPADPELVKLCGTTHDAVHTLLNEYVRHGGRPPWEDHNCLNGRKRPGRCRYNSLAQSLAATAWSRRPSPKPPYTSTHGGDPDDE